MKGAPARGFLIGMEGVLVRDEAPLSGAVEALVRLRAMGLPFRVLATPGHRTATEWSAWLLERGFSVDSEEVRVFDGPAPEVYERAARDLLLPADAKIVIVADPRDLDVAGARTAGLAPVLIQPADAPVPEDVDAVATDFNGYLYRAFRIR